MENELQERPPEPASNAESSCLSTPALLPPCAEPPPLANLYDDLQDGQIRLFELDTSTAENIVGRLQTVEMSSAPPFYALSYVCGSDACSEEITINDRAVLVKPNLFAALQELRSHFEGRQVARIAIWIDAICINQCNEAEKTKQILKMHGVFSGAVEVLVWLGAVDDNIRMVLRIFAWVKLYADTGGVIEALQKLREHVLSQCLELQHHVFYSNLIAMSYLLRTLNDIDQNAKNSRTWAQYLTAQELAVDMPLLKEDLFPPDHILWASLYALLELEWFGRVWTYQETHIAREATFLARDVCVP
jgi:hypothetical protein